MELLYAVTLFKLMIFAEPFFATKKMTISKGNYAYLR